MFDNIESEEELALLKGERRESKKNVKYYNSSIADSLINGNMGKEINEYINIEKDIEINPNKYKRNIFKRFFDNLFRTI